MPTNTKKQRSYSHGSARTIVGWFGAMKTALPGFYTPLLIFSVAINMLMLVTPIYMLQVYDRVLTSGSTDTLIWITGIALFLLAIYAAAEAGRRRVCTLAAEALEERLSERIFAHFENQQAGKARLTDDLMTLGRVRSLYQNQIVLPFFDLPFAPFFLLILFMIHPFIGVLGLAGAVIIFIVAVVAELTSRRTNELAGAASGEAFSIATGLSRQRSAMVAMGLGRNALGKWRKAKGVARELNLKAGSQEGGFSSIARSLRQVLQVLVLGAGAMLALGQEISPGAIVAGSIIMSRALAPIDQIVGSWRAIAQARTSWNQLSELDPDKTEARDYTPLPRPEAQLVIDRLAVQVPGVASPIIRPFGVTLPGGSFVSVVGGIGTGKTALLQTLAAAWTPMSGQVLLGGRDVHQWPSEDRGQYFGYVPQDVELMPGTIAENIARMSEAEPAAVIDAAKKAGAHEMILARADGYETVIGAHNQTGLSAGQRQLVGLARAMFGSPVILLLDEPTANLDPTAGSVIIRQLRQAAQDGAIIVAATHDPALIRASQTVLLVKDGAVLSAQSDAYLKEVGTIASSNITQMEAKTR